MTMIKRALVAATVSFATVIAPVNQVLAFTFTKIADSESIYSSFSRTPVINNSGVVVFTADLGEGGAGVFTGNGLLTTTVADTNGIFASFGQSVAISDNGAFAFKANLKSGLSGIYTDTNGVVVPVVEGTNYTALRDPVINDDGIVAFYGNLQGKSGIFTNKGGSINSIADTSRVYSILDSPNMNQSGSIAFSSSLDTGGRSIFVTDSDGRTSTVVDTDGEFDFLFNPAINNASAIAFKGVLDNLAGEGIYTVSDGSINKIADNSDRFNFFENPAINDGGKVVFKAVLKDGNLGIYTGVNLDTDKIIAAGDSLFGAQVTDIYMSSKSLNNNNQVVFYAKFADGSSGIFRADPDIPTSTSIPEPASIFGILTIGALAIGLKRQNRKQIYN
jgi:hypothetical protein